MVTKKTVQKKPRTKAAAKTTAKTHSTRSASATKPATKPVSRPTKKPVDETGPTNGKLEVVHVFTLNSRAAFDALSLTDRAQLEAVSKAFGQDGVDALYAWIGAEGMSFYKLALVRGGVPEWEVWINTAMDDGLVFAPGSQASAGIGVSQGDVQDMESRREAVCAEIERALRGFQLPPGKRLEDIFWQYES